MEMPRCLAPLGGNGSHSTEFLTNETVIAFTVKLRIGQHALNAGVLAGMQEQREKQRFIIAGTRARHLGENELAGEISDDHPFEPVAPCQAVSLISDTIDKERADRTRRKTGAVHRDGTAFHGGGGMA